MGAAKVIIQQGEPWRWAATAPRRCALIALLLLGLCAAPALGQSALPMLPTTDTGETPAELPDDLTREEFQALLSRISDQQARDLLLEIYTKNAAADPAARSQGLLAEARLTAERLSWRISELFSEAPGWGHVVDVFRERVIGFGGVAPLFAALIVAFGAGFIARYFWRRRSLARQIALAEKNKDVGAYASLSVIADAVLFLLIELSGVVVFWVVAMAALYLGFQNDDLRLFVSTYVAATAVLLAALAMVELCFPRSYAVYRLLPLDDAATIRLRAVVMSVVAIWAFGFFSVDLALNYGIDQTQHQLMIFGVATLFSLSTIVGVLVLERDISKAAPPLAADAQLTPVGVISQNWHVLAIGYSIVLWAAAMSRFLLSDYSETVGDIATNSLALIISLTILDLVIGCYLRAQKDLNAKLADAIRRTLRLLFLVVGAAIFLALWGFEFAQLGNAGVGGWLLRAIVDVAVTGLVGYAVWDLLRTAIDVRLAGEAPAAQPGESGGEGGAKGASRAATLLPLFRSFAFGVIAITCFFTAAASMGVNVAPLIAGAGVIGIAIGFGAQTLVRDVMSGVFFLIDDAFRRGEYVEIGSTMGTVERISVRSLQLRHHKGAVHTIPFGEIQTLTNYSRDWVIMKLPLRLTFDTDPAQVKKIIKKIGAEMMEDPELGPKLQEPPKSQGVIQMEDSAMILRVKFMATPGEQWVLRRELLHRIRSAFEEAGIRFANREVTVHVTADAPPAHAAEAAGAAARRLLEEEQTAPAAPKDDR